MISAMRNDSIQHLELRILVTIYGAIPTPAGPEPSDLLGSTGWCQCGPWHWPESPLASNFVFLHLSPQCNMKRGAETQINKGDPDDVEQEVCILDIVWAMAVWSSS